jgi:hypothetical protein
MFAKIRAQCEMTCSEYLHSSFVKDKTDYAINGVHNSPLCLITSIDILETYVRARNTLEETAEQLI